MKIYKRILFSIATLSLLLVGCTNQWDDHVRIDTPELSGTVLDALKGQANLSTFYNMVVETGYDALLESDNSFTLLAPDNSALAAYTSSSLDDKRNIVSNHIAYLAYNAAALAGKDRLKMVNGKNLTLSGLSISNKDVLCNNGIIHSVNKVTEPAMSIYEYLEAKGMGHSIQLDTLLSHSKRIMDMDKSVQIGVNDEGFAIYDTVWAYSNHFLDKMPLANEDSLYTFVLVTDEDFTRISSRYAKYMVQDSQERTDSIAADQLLCDLVFAGTDINPQGAAEVALTDVAVDFSNAAVQEEYIASNGVVRIVQDANIKLKNNKIKDIIIEGENWSATLDAKYTFNRLRTWASGGQDMMVAASTRQDRDSLDIDGNPVLDESGNVIKITYYYHNLTSTYRSTNTNFYVEYNVPVLSAKYKIHWMSYNDNPNHVNSGGYPDTTLELWQKLLISLPGKTKLSRNSSSKLLNNYLGSLYAFAASSTAGVRKEVQLTKYQVDNSNNQYLERELTEEDVMSDGSAPEIFISPSMGNATFWVCNTTHYNGSYAGTLFLDYIRLEPIIDDED
ncbi:hypothetical protein D0T50_00865 [Bacteroides sp. 214]|uniref:fasciclin domain-containing protein n=1 Tax=Bacteroides sp. 214 TaxID=2302935 RepID=UPI0013D5B278|nr:fasciclin domain-containing protein [Bacteroides sp. 214]NDW11439.1 hypothetical protein [Bacteroides sp. 214]